MITYHFCAMHQPHPGAGLTYMSGLVVREVPINNYEDYSLVKSNISDRFDPPVTPDKLTITSLTVISG